MAGFEEIPLSAQFSRKAVAVLVIGMAGSGKTTLMHRLNLHMLEKGLRGYYVNLDPAVKTVPFGANIDIRDTVNYKEVISQYNLGRSVCFSGGFFYFVSAND